MKRTRSNSVARAARGAFTIIELMVVIAIIVLLVTLAVPAFGAMLYSAERSLAENGVRVGITVARDLATRSERGGDGAVMFSFDPGSGRTRLVPLEQVGTMRDRILGGRPGNGFIAANSGPFAERDVFVPSVAAEATVLPKYWNVRGFAPGPLFQDPDGAAPTPTVSGEWYGSSPTAPDLGGGNPVEISGEPAWIFPEDNFYDVEALDDDVASSNRARETGRQSFIVRFDGFTGVIRRDGRSAVVVDPRPSDTDRDIIAANRNAPLAYQRVDYALNTADWARSIAARGDFNAPGTNGYGVPLQSDDLLRRSQLIGKRSLDTVLVKDVSRVALYDERRLAQGLGVRRLNPQTDSLYMPYQRSNGEVDIQIDESLLPPALRGDRNELRRAITSWISGDTNRDGLVNSNDTPESVIFSVQSYTGEVREIEQ